MPSVREFIEKLQSRINSLLPDASAPAIESENLDILLRYESEWAFDGLRMTLEDMLAQNALPLYVIDNNGKYAVKRDRHNEPVLNSQSNPELCQPFDVPQLDDELGPQNIMYFVALLHNRLMKAQNTDVIYNNSPDSLANQAYQFMAEELANVLNGDEEEKKYHAYDFMFSGIRLPEYSQGNTRFSLVFPGVNLGRFVTSKGSLYELSLAEFFWGEEYIPIEVIACLDQYRKIVAENQRTGTVNKNYNNPMPAYVCLSEEDLQVRESKSISKRDLKSLCTHSEAANSYYRGITHAISTGNWQAVDDRRAVLENMMSDKHFTAKVRYTKSGYNLLSKNWLQFLTPPVRDLSSLAALLVNNVDLKDWEGFLLALEDGKTGYFLDSIVLPNNNGKPDTSLFMAENYNKFIAFVSNPELYNNVSDLQRRAILFILTVLYRHHRDNQNDLTGRASILTEGYFFGHVKDKKVAASSVFLEFLIDTTYQLNQLTRYLRDKKATVHDGVLKSKGDRLSKLVEIAQSMGPTPEFGSKTLHEIAKAMSSIDKSLWQNYLSAAKFRDNDLQIIVDSNGGLANCVKTAGHYRRMDDDYNRAVLYILAECYQRQRITGDNHTGYVSKLSGYTPAFLQGYDKTAKVNAVKAFKKFLADDEYKLNKLSEFLSHEGDKSVEGALRDGSLFGSELRALVDQAEKVSTTEYFDQAGKKVENSGGWTSYFGLG